MLSAHSHEKSCLFFVKLNLLHLHRSNFDVMNTFNGLMICVAREYGMFTCITRKLSMQVLDVFSLL